MVLLDFDAESLLAKRTGSDPWEAHSEVPVSLTINGLDLFGWNHSWGGRENSRSEPYCDEASSTSTTKTDGIVVKGEARARQENTGSETTQDTKLGLPLSVINVAWWGLVTLKLAKQTEGATLWLGMYGDRGELLFRMSGTGEDVLVHSTFFSKTAQVNYDKLEAAWREFAKRVREFLLREFPTLKDQPYFTEEWKEPGWQEWLAGVEATHLPVRLPLLVTVWGLNDRAKYEYVFDNVDVIER